MIYFDNHKGNDTYTVEGHLNLISDFFENGKETESGAVEPLIIENLNVFQTDNAACAILLNMKVILLQQCDAHYT